MSLKQQAVKGVFWSAIERFSVQGIQFVLSFIIARQLFPSDYGLIAMLTIFMAIAQSFIDSGFSNALIQKQDRTQTDFSTVFYFNIIVGLFAYIILVICAPLIANFYNQPLLEEIIIWVGLNLVISSFSTVQRAILTIELNFKKQAVISLVSVIISGIVAVYMAYNGYGVWTLVTQGLLTGTISTLLLWLSTKWYPSIVFSIESFKQLFSFGSKILASGLLHTVYVNLYTLVIGKIYNTQELGLYNRAHSIAQHPSNNIVNLLNKVIYPILCRLQNNEDELIDKYFLFFRQTIYVVFPMMIGLATLAEPLVNLVLSEKWLHCVPYLQILCIAYMWDPIMNFSCGLINAKGRSDYYLKAEIIKKIVAIFILCITIPFGVLVMCIGLVIYAFMDILIITRFTKRVLKSVTLIKYLKVVAPILLQSLIMALLIMICINYVSTLWAQVICGMIIGIVSYLLLSLFICKNEFMWFYHLIMDRK